VIEVINSRGTKTHKKKKDREEKTAQSQLEKI
jgi:hypothetical protein